MPTTSTGRAHLLELCSMLRAIAVTRRDARPLLRAMAETYEIRAVVEQMPESGA